MALMKLTAFVINAARGPIIEEDALVQACRRAGWLALASTFLRTSPGCIPPC